MKRTGRSQVVRPGSQWLAVFAGMVLLFTSLPGMAQEIGDRVQVATGEGHEAVATLGQKPKEGNLLVVISSHRVSWNEATIEGAGWNQALEMVFDADNTSIRRGMAVWYKTAGPNEPLSVRTRWYQDGNITAQNRKNAVVVMEFEGTFVRDTAASDASFGSTSTGVYTGMTEVSTSLPSLVIGAAHARGNASEADWTNGLENNFRFYTSAGGDGNHFTIQSAHRMSDENRTWDAEAFWGNSAGASIGAITVFKPYDDVEWNFSSECSVPSTFPIVTIDPSVVFMLDRSGSMQNLRTNICYYPPGNYYYWCGPTLWSVAVNSIIAVIGTLQDELDFGLGYFHWYAASMVVEAMQGNSNAIIANWLNSNSPVGWTPTWEAVRVTAESETLGLPASAGILITDGIPEVGGDSSVARRDTLTELCKARNAGQTHYVVGLGGGTNTDFNNLMAAAAGTGSCSGGEVCSGDNVAIAGVENNTSFWQNCEGSYSAANQDEFTNVLLSIGGVVSCTFPLDVTSWPNGLVDDYRAVKVSVNGGITELEHSELSADGEGWYFTNENRNSVTLTDKLCEQSRDPEEGFTEVTVQVACSCEVLVAEEPECLLSNVAATYCPMGTKTCNPDQTWYCEGPAEPMNEDCPFFSCPTYDEPELCHVGNEYFFNFAPPGQGGSSIVSSNDFDPSLEVNRCQVGVMACDEENGVRCMALSPMPEICNGLDNDCDGTMANFTESWEYYEGAYSLEEENAEGAACNMTDACICTEGPRAHGGLNAIFNGLDQTAEFSEYIDYYLMEVESGESCVCQAL